MAKKPKDDREEFSLIAKAIRRSEKLERTLTKLISLNEAQPHANSFLKAVKRGLKHLRKEPETLESKTKSSNGNTKAVTSPQPKKASTTPVAVKRERKPKIPDIAASTDTKTKQLT